jgi:hypothetical protein
LWLTGLVMLAAMAVTVTLVVRAGTAKPNVAWVAALPGDHVYASAPAPSPDGEA